VARDLHTLIRLREWSVDNARRKLAELLRLVEDLEGQARALEDEIAAEQAVARATPNDAGVVYGAFARAAIKRRERIAASIDQIEEEIAVARDELRDAYRELKKYEIAQDARDLRAAEEEGRRDQAVLDEIGLQGHRRRAM